MKNGEINPNQKILPTPRQAWQIINVMSKTQKEQYYESTGFLHNQTKSINDAKFSLALGCISRIA